MNRPALRAPLILALFALGCGSGCDAPPPKKEPTASAQAAKDRVKAAANPKVDAPVGADSQLDAAPANAAEPTADAEDEFTGYDPRVARAARIARDIAAEPARADAVLGDHGLDRTKLDALMYEIAGDEDLTEQYRIARGL